MHPTCPQCRKPLTSKHCAAPACPWRKCAACGIDVDQARRTIPHRP